MRELTHRTKNLLSVVQAMSLQIAKTSPSLDDFTTRFSARLQSLSGSHDLLVQQNWEGVSMADLARSQLGHYADAIGSRITLTGPAVRLSPDAAQNIGMALHELSTNAAKHGALSAQEDGSPSNGRSRTASSRSPGPSAGDLRSASRPATASATRSLPVS